MKPVVLSKKARKQLADAYVEAQGPFPLTIDGQDFVVMSMTDFENCCGQPLAEFEQRMLHEGYAEAMRGEVRPAREMIAELRAEFGL